MLLYQIIRLQMQLIQHFGWESLRHIHIQSRQTWQTKANCHGISSGALSQLGNDKVGDARDLHAYKGTAVLTEEAKWIKTLTHISCY